VYPPANDLLEEIARLKASLAAKDQVIEEQKEALAGTRLLLGSFTAPTSLGSSPAPDRYKRQQLLVNVTAAATDLVGENERLKTELQELATKEVAIAAEDTETAELVSKEMELRAKEREIGALKLALQAKDEMMESSSLTEVRQLRSILTEKEAKLKALRLLRC